MRLRDLTHEDAEMVRGWRNQPDVAAHMYTDHTITAGEHDLWLDRALNDPTCRYWIIEHLGQCVGLSCLYDHRPQWKRCQWAFYVARADLRGRGVGALGEFATIDRAFVEWPIDKLACEVLAVNHAVVKGHLEFGFASEGLLRRHVIKQGQPHDVVVLGLLREEWEARRPVMAARIARIEERLERISGGPPVAGGCGG
jgi:UDP-4-amino-4,6-dideoxy-N-acetyl-beta-L-altrosamine N-acetyltransferase